MSQIRPIPLPGWAYVPGQTERHPEGSFDQIRDTAQPGMSAGALVETDAWQVGLLFLDKGYFWEAHEVLEPVWLALPANSREKALVQAIIQIANAELKLRMDRPKAVLRLCDLAEELLRQASTAGECMHVDSKRLHQRIHLLRSTAALIA